MEDNSKNQQSSATASGKSKLRYPLRSATKLKQDKSPDALNSSSAPRRGRPTSNVSQSVNVLDLSGKEKSCKPTTRRLSIPAKSAGNPGQKLTSSITPISEASVRRSISSQGKSDTPRSDVSKSSARRRFCMLSSASYWLSQIKLSESAAKHSISLGFFKLALEAGCEPLHLLRDELKSYARRHNLAELGEPLKALFQSYEISETLEQLQVSENCSQVPENGSPSSDEVVPSSGSTTGTRKLKPKSLNIDAPPASSVREPSKKYNFQRNVSTGKVRASLTKTSMNQKSATESGGHNSRKKAQKSIEHESASGQDKVKMQEESAAQKVPVAPLDMETVDEDKENMDTPSMEAVAAN
ncbi:hypothetical protein Ancab_035883 [Ancistrocladus abbreviatus]